MNIENILYFVLFGVLILAFVHTIIGIFFPPKPPKDKP